jgi:hypothetical protein
MTRKTTRFAAALTSLAAFSMAATPAMAQGWGWGGRHHHRDRVDAGDILTGILIIGGIAAIASAASNSSKRDRDRRRDDDRRYPDEQYRRDSNAGYGQDNRPEWRERSSSSAAGGIDGAVNACIDELARGSARVDGVDAVNREGKGWRVQGQTIKGGTFVCSVDQSGRVTEVSVDGKAY